VSLTALTRFAEGTPVLVGCMIAELRPTVTKNGKSAGKKMAMMTIEDITGKCDAVAFSETYERTAELLKPEALVFISGTVDRRREKPSIIVNEVFSLDDGLEKFTRQVAVKLNGNTDESLLARIKEIAQAHKGSCALGFKIAPAGRSDVTVWVSADKTWCVRPTRELLKELEDAAGDNSVSLLPKEQPINNRRNGFRRNGGYNGYSGGGSRSANEPASAAVTRFN